MLRSGKVNSDLLDIETIKAVIKEGLQIYPELEFPIVEISRHSLNDIMSFITIKNLGFNNFIALIPLVYPQRYNIVSMIPHPMQLAEKLLIAEINEIFLYDMDNYVITTANQLHSINNLTHILQKVEPVWNINHTSCELSCFLMDTENIVRLCNFKNLGIPSGIYLTNTPSSRLVFTTQETQLELKCPSGMIRQSLEGITYVPNNCDIKTHDVSWPAELSHELDIEVLVEGNVENPFDITNLPIFTINKSTPLHDSIKKLIDDLPSDNPFVIPFETMDLSLEEVQTYSILAHGSLIIFVIINFILIIVLYCLYLRKRNDNNRNDIETGKNGRIRDSLTLPLRNSFRRVQHKLKTLKHDVDNMSQSGVSSTRSSLSRKVKSRGRQLRRSIKKRVRTRSRESNNSGHSSKSVGTNTTPNQLYPSIPSSVSSPRTYTKNQNIPLKAYNTLDEY